MKLLVSWSLHVVVEVNWRICRVCEMAARRSWPSSRDLNNIIIGNYDTEDVRF